MTDDNKTHKTVIVEVFNAEYKVSNKSLSSINNKFLLFIGFVKYILNKVYNKTFARLLNNIDKTFCFGIINIFFTCLFVMIPLCVLFTFEEIYTIVNQCNNKCEIYINNCVNHVGDATECVRNNIYFHKVFIKNFSKSVVMSLNILCYAIIALIIMAIVVNIIYFISVLCCKLFNKVMYQVKKYNEFIPDYEEV